MTHKRTVRCSYCHHKGHNRAGCPDLKKYVEDNPDSWTAQRVAQKKVYRSRRACSYCKETGHNRRSCESLRADKSTAVSLNRDWRRKAADHLKREGWAVGTLLRVSDYHRTETLFMVTRMLWDSMDFRVLLEDGTKRVCEIQRLDKLGTRDYYSHDELQYPPDAHAEATLKGRDWGWSTTIEVVSALPPEAVEAQMPDGWNKGDDSNKEMLKSIFDGVARWNVAGWRGDEG